MPMLEFLFEVFGELLLQLVVEALAQAVYECDLPGVKMLAGEAAAVQD